MTGKFGGTACTALTAPLRHRVQYLTDSRFKAKTEPFKVIEIGLYIHPATGILLEVKLQKF